MANWRFIAAIQAFLGDEGPVAPRLTLRQQQLAHDMKRNGWALASLRRLSVKEQKVLNADVDPTRLGGLSAPPPPRSKP